MIKTIAQKKIKKHSFKPDTLYYNSEKDYYVCPMGMQCIGTHQTKTKTGFIQTISRYQAANCNGCPLRGVCHKSKGNRIIEVNHALNKYKEQISELKQ